MKNLFNYWDNPKKELNNKYIMLFLDFDGTLTPIVATPQQAILSKETKDVLDKLSRNSRYKIAIISGRALKNIKEKVGLKNIIYVGNHGAEIEGPKIKFASPISPRCRAILEHIKTDLEEKLSSIKGAILEDKGLSLSVHFRLVDKSQIPQVKAIVHECAILYLVRSKIKIKTGKMVLEIRLPLEWDKGKVVLWLLARQKFATSERPFVPIYIGDDKTDEDAFKVLKNKGLTIFVGKPKPSYAQYYLKNTREVTQFLKRILDLKEK
jgi:trehalose-phosphatase